jgi:hypothetical protein
MARDAGSLVCLLSLCHACYSSCAQHPFGLRSTGSSGRLQWLVVRVAHFSRTRPDRADSCPCHGSHYDSSGRIRCVYGTEAATGSHWRRKGPAPVQDLRYAPPPLTRAAVEPRSAGVSVSGGRQAGDRIVAARREFQPCSSRSPPLLLFLTCFIIASPRCAESQRRHPRSLMFCRRQSDRRSSVGRVTPFRVHCQLCTLSRPFRAESGMTRS